MSDFKVEATEALALTGPSRLDDMYVLSPFVWREGETFHMLARAVPRRDDEPRLKVAEIWYGRSRDGVAFRMDDGPVVSPGPEAEDLDGCEDPTVVVRRDRVLVWYTGWNQREETGRLLLASGPDPRRLTKRGVALDSSANLRNPKEATAVRLPDGPWKLFYEFARDDASAIGLAQSVGPEGPWTPQTFDLQARPQAWDSWHLSTGPVIGAGSERPVMFYNGATRDAHWRIGWLAFDRDLTRVVGRSRDPLVTPGNLQDGWTDIAFAASAVETAGEVSLYYSVADRLMMRARLRPR